MKIAVIDDERPARKELVYLLETCLEKPEIFEGASGKEAIALLKEQEVDSVFLDVNLGDMTGTTLASIIKKEQPKAAICFTTAYQEYAVKAFELEAVDYVLKPYDLKRIEQTVEKIKRHTRNAEIKKVPVTVTEGIRLLEKKEILYIESSQRNCVVHTKDASYTENNSLHYYEELLQEGFLRIHKSYLVQLEAIETILPLSVNGYGIKLQGLDTVIPIGRSQMRLLRKMFDF